MYLQRECVRKMSAKCGRLFRGLIVHLAFLVCACGPALVRNPVPEAMVGQAHPLGIPGLRDRGDALNPDEVAAFIADRGAFMKATYGPRSRRAGRRSCITSAFPAAGSGAPSGLAS
jgi:hypothetical protein